MGEMRGEQRRACAVVSSASRGQCSGSKGSLHTAETRVTCSAAARAARHAAGAAGSPQPSSSPSPWLASAASAAARSSPESAAAAQSAPGSAEGHASAVGSGRMSAAADADRSHRYRSQSCECFSEEAPDGESPSPLLPVLLRSSTGRSPNRRRALARGLKASALASAGASAAGGRRCDGSSQPGVAASLASGTEEGASLSATAALPQKPSTEYEYGIPSRAHTSSASGKRAVVCRPPTGGRWLPASDAAGKQPASVAARAAPERARETGSVAGAAGSATHTSRIPDAASSSSARRALLGSGAGGGWWWPDAAAQASPCAAALKWPAKFPGLSHWRVTEERRARARRDLRIAASRCASVANGRRRHAAGSSAPAAPPAPLPAGR